MGSLNQRERFYKDLIEMGYTKEKAMEITLQIYPDSRCYHPLYPLIWIGEQKEEPPVLKGKWYVTEYQVTEGYEPVIEGGYPYSEADWSEIHQFNRRKDAVRYMRKMRKELKEAVSKGVYINYSENANKMWCGADDNEHGMSGVFCQLERKAGCSVSHYEGYC